ncbi:membrane-targeted effector domain-containing toxin [Pseudomonas sp. S2.OTC.A_B10]|uniref:membrane-targeted effector domain-containing toxin n=1 Tax=Pseudomonas sp. S2.OTC.A_B10 TaxID=3237018 RepID=UPI003CE95D72
MQDAPNLPNAADATALKALVPALVEACPDMYEMATQFAKKILAEHAINLDPEKVYWHRFHSSQSNPKTLSGWEHIEHPHDSMTLTQLVITRFTVHYQDNADLLDNDCGFYTAGPEAGTYDQTNEIRLSGSQVMKSFWAFNFADHYKTAVASFWSSQGTPFRTLAKSTFLAKAIEDYEDGRLSADNFRTVVKAAACNVNWPVTLQMLETEVLPSPAVRIRRLKVGSYVASDILCFVDRNERQILYVPGETWGFHVLECAEDLHWWVLSQVEQPQARKRFMAHFQVADHDIMQDTNALTSTQEWLLAAFPTADLLHTLSYETRIENIGLNHVLDLLFNAWKANDHHLLAVQDAWVCDDPFTHLRDATHARMISDAGYMLHSNGELRKKLWIGYLNAFGRMFGPLAAVGWPVALAVVGAGIANVGMNIDQAVNGKTPTERKAGVSGAVLAAIDTLFNAMFLKGGEGLPQIAQGKDLVAPEERLGTAALSETELSLLHTLTPERVSAPGGQESFLATLRTEITEGTQAGTGARKGIIETSSGKTYIYLSEGTTSGYFQVRYVKEAKGWVIIDPKNPWSFYRNVPVRLNAYSEWEPVPAPGLKGGGRMFGLKPWGQAPDAPLPEVQTPGTAYDVPEAQRPGLQPAANGNVDPKDLNEEYLSNDRHDAFKALRRKLHDDARDFFVDPPLPARPRIPTFTLNAPPKDIIKQLLKDGPGLVIGENHSNVASKRFLIESMPLLARQKVRTLYLEHLLSDFHQADLDLFSRSGEMPQSLGRYLQDLDEGHRTDPTGQYTFLEVVKAAQTNRLRIKAIDCMASYRSSGILDADVNYRQKMMNYFARTLITADQGAAGPHKWVALVGDSHANTFNGVPGLSELEGAVGLRIEDAGIGKARGIEPDPGRTAVEPGSNSTTVRNDLRLQLEMPVDILSARKLGKYLPDPGMYARDTETGQALFVSRDRNGLIKCTPLKRDKTGYFVERPEWASIHGKRFKTVDALNAALRGRGMREIRIPEPPAAAASAAAPPPAVPKSYASNLILEGETLNTQPGKFFRTYRLKFTGDLPSHAILMNGESYYVRFEADVNGPGHLAIVDPINPDGFNRSIPVRLNAEGEWEPAPSSKLKGGGKNQSKPAVTPPAPIAEPRPGPSSPRPRSYSAYDVQPQVLEDTHSTFTRDADGQVHVVSRGQREIAKARERLLNDAQTFFNTPRTTPSRPVIPALIPGISEETFIEQALDTAPGLVIGEPRGGIGSKEFLIKNMAALSRARVRTLFIKGLITESHQAHLETFTRTRTMPSELRQSLMEVDRAAGNDPSQRFNLLEVVRAAQANNIRVQALDCMASIRGHGELPNDGFSRRWVNNYLTHQQIQRYKPAASSERWVALVDPMSTNTYRELPGISELDGAISLRIEDVPEGEGTSFMIDPGAEAHEQTIGTFTVPEQAMTTQLGPVTASSDVRLQLETPWLTPGQKSLGDQLRRPGFYTLSSWSGQPTLIHFSRNAGAVYSPIQVNAQGKFYLLAPTWPTIDQRPFDSLVDLMQALSTEKSMTLANWSKPLWSVPAT